MSPVLSVPVSAWVYSDILHSCAPLAQLASLCPICWRHKFVKLGRLRCTLNTNRQWDLKGSIMVVCNCYLGQGTQPTHGHWTFSMCNYMVKLSSKPVSQERHHWYQMRIAAKFSRLTEECSPQKGFPDDIILGNFQTLMFGEIGILMFRVVCLTQRCLPQISLVSFSS